MKKKAAKKSKRMSQSYVSTARYGLLNPWGALWSPETFGSIPEALSYLKAWSAHYNIDLSKHTVAPVRVTVTPLKS